MDKQRENPEFIENSIQLRVEHWEDEISFLEQRLGGVHVDIDDEDREACLDALEIAKENLADAKSHLNKG
jgi:sugar/nucleoside kinase (ribokinase family)